MKKQVSLTQKLPPFRINLEGLELLLKKLGAEFDLEPRIKIYIYLNDTKYEFSSVQEIRNCPDNLAKAKNFDISLYSDTQWIRLSVENKWYVSEARIRVESSREVWSSGLIKSIPKFMKPYKRWYSFIKKMPLGVIFFILSALPLILILFGFKFSIHSFGIWISILSIIALVKLGSSYFFPSAVLYIKEDQSIIRKYQSELTLLLALLGIFIAALQLITKR